MYHGNVYIDWRMKFTVVKNIIAFCTSYPRTSISCNFRMLWPCLPLWLFFRGIHTLATSRHCSMQSCSCVVWCPPGHCLYWTRQAHAQEKGNYIIMFVGIAMLNTVCNNQCKTAQNWCVLEWHLVCKIIKTRMNWLVIKKYCKAFIMCVAICLGIVSRKAIAWHICYST